MSRLGLELATLLAALDTGGVRTATSGKLTAPCVLVEPGEPWSEPHRMGSQRRIGRWRLTAIAGAVDTDAGIAELEAMIDAIDAALLPVDGAQLPTWARPTTVEMADGVRRPASIATIQYASS